MEMIIVAVANILIGLIWFVTGIFIENNEIITEPAYFSLYGYGFCTIHIFIMYKLATSRFMNKNIANKP